MESGFCWIYLWMVVVLSRNIWADPASPPRYTVHHTQVSFDRALEECSPGVLTTLATEQEVDDILGLVSRSVSGLHQNEFMFWVGLRKVKNECVVPTLPLRGFKWVEDGSEETQESRWAEEPKHTCTTVRCAALKARVEGSTVMQWGLIPVTCKKSYQFICKLRDQPTGGTPKPAAPEPATPEPKPAAPPKPATPEPEPATPEPKPAAPPKPVTPEPEPATPEPKPAAPPKPATPEPEPATPEPKPAAPELELASPEPKPAASGPHKPGPRPATQKPEATTPEPELPTRGTEPETDLKPKPGSELQGPHPDPGADPALGSDSCQRPQIPGYRSFSLDPTNSSRIQVECWSSVQLELHCSGRPAVWRLLDDSPANLTTVCQPCDEGFQKDASDNCVDIDECSDGGGGCRHTCRNTEGSFRCVCLDENGKHQDEDSPLCADTPVTGDNSLMSGILVPVLIAVAALVVLVVVVAVTVKCCLMRRSKKRAMKKAEKMAMKSNEKVAI